MLAHSLGNMLVSSAAKDHGLNYSKYYMLNAAVPMETYDNGSFSSVMCDEEWNKVQSNYLAANWSKLFPANDFRASLSWRGRFAGIANAINCYSPTEDVLANAEVGQLTLSGGAWKIQELTKGKSSSVHVARDNGRCVARQSDGDMASRSAKQCENR